MTESFSTSTATQQMFQSVAMSSHTIPPPLVPEQEDVREMNPPLFRAASPHHRTASPAASILRSVDGNSNETLMTTPTKMSSMMKPLRPCFRRFELMELAEESAGAAASPFSKNNSGSAMATTVRVATSNTSTTRMCGTPNSLDLEMLHSPLQQAHDDEEDDGRPQCTNPVGLTLWHKAASLESPLSPTPHLAAAPPAALLRPTATRAADRSMGVC